MKINDAFPSAYLKASDFEGDTVVTIKAVTMEDIGQGNKKEHKAIVHFNEFDKGLVLNVTNKNAIEGLYGDETDDWAGKQVTLFPTEVEFAGEQVMAIRVRLRKPTATRPPSPTSSAAPDNASSTLMAARQKAWETFKAPFNGASTAEITPAWRELLAAAVPGKSANEYTIADWNKVLLKASEPTSPLSETPEFAESEIPF